MNREPGKRTPPISFPRERPPAGHGILYPKNYRDQITHYESPTMLNRDVKLEWRKLLLNYQWIVRNIPFFLFLCLLTLLYIYNGHYAEKTIKDINKTARELKELQYEHKTIRSELMFQSKQSELVKAVQPLGLRELTQPPLKLKDTILNSDQ